MNKALFWLWGMGARGMATAAREAYGPMPGKYHNGRKPRRRGTQLSLGEEDDPCTGP